MLHGWLLAIVSYDVWVLSRCCQERDCNAVSFEHQFICQSLCKCDRSLSQEFFVYFLFFNICPLLKVQVFSFALPLHNKASVYITNSLAADSTRSKTNVTNFTYRKKVGITETLFEGDVNVNY